MRIDKLIISIEPWRFHESFGLRELDMMELRVSIKTDGHDITQTEVIDKMSDMDSRFDVIFDRAKRAIKSHFNLMIKDKGHQAYGD